MVKMKVNISETLDFFLSFGAIRQKKIDFSVQWIMGMLQKQSNQALTQVNNMGGTKKGPQIKLSLGPHSILGRDSAKLMFKTRPRCALRDPLYLLHANVYTFQMYIVFVPLVFISAVGGGRGAVWSRR